MIGLIILAVIVGVVTLAVIIRKIVYYQNYTKWKVGDLIKTDDYKLQKELDNHNLQFAELAGWDKHNVYVVIGKLTHKIPYTSIDYNKSYVWRKNYELCKKVMGTDPAFSSSVANEPIKSNSGSLLKIDGKDISTMTETECQVYLNIALRAEKYEQADAIKKRMEHFR